MGRPELRHTKRNGHGRDDRKPEIGCSAQDDYLLVEVEALKGRVYGDPYEHDKGGSHDDGPCDDGPAGNALATFPTLLTTHTY